MKKMNTTFGPLLTLSLLVFSLSTSAQPYTGGGFFGKLVDGGDYCQRWPLLVLMMADYLAL